MKKTLRILAVIMVVAILMTVVSVFVGCDNNNSNNNNNNNNNNSSEETINAKITVWVSETQGVAELTRQQIEDFNQSQTQFKIEATVEGVTEADAATKMISDLETGADLYCFAQDQLARLVQAGALAVPGVNATNTIKDSNDAGAVGAATVGEQVYAYPLTSDNGYFLFYDKSIVSESSLGSLEAILADCTAAGRNFSMELDTSAWYLASFFFATGCHSNWNIDETGNPVSIDDTFNSDAGLVAMKGIQILEKSANYVSSSDAAQFDAAIKAGAVVTGTWGLNAASDILGDDLGFCKLPSFTVDGKTYQLGSFSGNKLIGVKPQKDVKRQAALQALALYLTNKECQLARFEEFGWGPSNKEAQADPSVQANKPLAALAAQNAHAVPQGQIDGSWWDIAKVLGTRAKEADLGDEAALKAALDEYDAAISKVINKDEAAKNAWTVVGSIKGYDWDKDIEMKEAPATVWTTKAIYLDNGSEFKVRKGQKWDNGETGNVSANPGPCETLEGGNAKCTQDGWYLIKFDQVAGEITLIEATPALVGSFNGWGTTEDVALTAVEGETPVYTAELTVDDAAELKVRFNASWDFGDFGTADGGNVNLAEAGTYVVTLAWDAENSAWVLTAVAK